MSDDELQYTEETSHGPLVIGLHIHDELVEKLWLAESREDIRRTLREWIKGHSS